MPDDHHDAAHDHQNYALDDHHDAAHDHQNYALDGHHDAAHDRRNDVVHDLIDHRMSDHDRRYRCHSVNRLDHRELARVVGTKAHLMARAHR